MERTCGSHLTHKEIKLEMAIKVQPADIRSGPILMGWILPNSINNRIGYGSLKNHLKLNKNSRGDSCGDFSIKKKPLVLQNLGILLRS